MQYPGHVELRSRLIFNVVQSVNSILPYSYEIFSMYDISFFRLLSFQT